MSREGHKKNHESRPVFGDREGRKGRHPLHPIPPILTPTELQQNRPDLTRLGPKPTAQHLLLPEHLQHRRRAGGARGSTRARLGALGARRAAGWALKAESSKRGFSQPCLVAHPYHRPGSEREASSKNPLLVDLSLLDRLCAGCQTRDSFSCSPFREVGKESCHVGRCIAPRS